VVTLRTVCATEIKAQAALVSLRMVGLGMVGFDDTFCNSKGCNQLLNVGGRV